MPEQESSEWFQLVLDSMTEFVLVKDERSRLLWANQAFCDYYGVTRAELKDQVDGSHSDPDDTLQYVRDDRQVLRTGAALTTVEPVTRHDGNVEYYATIKTRMADARTNTVLGTVGTSRGEDDPMLREASATMRGLRKDTASMLRQVVDVLPVSALLLDAKKRVVASTPRLRSTFALELEAGEEYGQALEHLVPLEETIDAVLDDGAPVDDQPHTVPSIGRSFEVSLRPWQMPDGEAVGVMVKLNDVTKRVRVEDALKERNLELQEANRETSAARSELANIISSLSTGALVTDRDGHVLLANSEAKRVLASEKFDGAPADWTEASGLRTASGDPLPHDRLPIVRALAGEEVRNEWVLRKTPGEASERWVSISASPIKEATNAAAVMTVSDVTERQQTLRELEEFAYVASHDLQEPLRMVRSFMGLLKDEHSENLDASGQEYVKFAHDGAERMSVLVSDLLRFSRAGAEAMALRPLSLSDLFADVIAEQKTEIEASGASVALPALPMVTADKSQLLHVVRNLMSNALKFRHPDRPPIIRVSATERDRDTLVEIEDNGIGFEARFANKVFRMFQRLNSRSRFPGTGIGLAISKRAIERHHGSIGVRSEPDQGSLFWFTLPRETPQ
ncbi:MAG: PAS domain-containing protein [Nannocystales bacterium]